MSLRHLVLHGFLRALVVSLPRLALAQNVTAGTVVYGTGQPAGTNWAGGDIAAGATLRLDPGATVSGGLGRGGGTFQFNSTGALPIATDITTSDGVGNGLFSVTNTGTVTATSATGYPESNTPFRTVSVSAGQLRLVWSDGTTPLNYQVTANNPLTITGGAGSGISVGDLTNNGTLAFNQSNNYTSSDSISGSGAVTKAGAGTLTLGGANSFTGGVAISGGTLAMGSSTALGSGGSLAVNGGTLDLRGRALTVNALSGSSAGTIQSGVAGVVTLTATAATSSTFAGSIGNGSGTVALTKSGTGTLRLSGSNTYTGTTTISSGTLQIGAGGTTGSIAGNVANDATLAFNRSDASTYSGTVSGTGGLTKQAAGLLTLAGANSYTGRTTISGSGKSLAGLMRWRKRRSAKAAA